MNYSLLTFYLLYLLAMHAARQSSIITITIIDRHTDGETLTQKIKTFNTSFCIYIKLYTKRKKNDSTDFSELHHWFD